WKPLAGLATLPVIPVFGTGRVRVQPVDVDALAAGLLALAREPWDSTGAGAAATDIDFGGPETLSFEDMLQRMRRAARPGSGPGRTLHVPVRPFMGLLDAAEKILGPRLPVTAGQLTTFVSDSNA